MVWFRKWMIFIHRWLGIVLSLLFVVWFISGIGMMYAGGMPSLSRQARLEHLPALDFSRVRLTHLEAAEKAGPGTKPGAATLLNLMDRPAYRFSGVTVFADNGELFESVDQSQARTIASRFINLPETSLEYAGRIVSPDQWTIAERGQLPMYKFTAQDAAHSALYVSEGAGEVGLHTTRGTRALAWVAAIPHWLYFTSLRTNGPLWSRVVIWSSGVGTVLAIIGIIVGIIQFSRSKPHIPYKGWMRWHYITGAVFGVFTVTWVFSGMLSMDPFPRSDNGSGDGIYDTLTGGSLDLSSFPAIDAKAWDQVLGGRAVKELEFLRIQGEPYYLAQTAGAAPLLISAAPLQVRHEPFSLESLMVRVKEGNPGFRVAESGMLTEYDSYYYPRLRQPQPLPVLRVKFDDPGKTWFYIDPAMSEVVGRATSGDRLERWVYNGLHSLDFSFWYYNRPAWDIGVIVLSLGGAATSAIGLFIGMKRVLRHLKRIGRARAAALAGTLKGD